MHIPTKPSGDGKSSDWFRWAHDQLVAFSNMKIRGGRIEKGTNSCNIIPAASAVSGGIATPQPDPIFVQLKVKTIKDNYLVCRTWDGTSEGAEDINTAKPIRLRRITYDTKEETILGFTHTFAYGSANRRVATVSGKAWKQNVYPEYKAEDVIYATMPSGGTGVIDADNLSIAVDYLDLNIDCRTWETVIGICDGGKVKEMLAGTAPGGL